MVRSDQSDRGDVRRRHTAQELIERMRRDWPQVTSNTSDLSMGFLRMNALLREAAQRALRRLELSTPEFDVLVALRATPPPHELTPSELYHSVLVSAGGVTNLLRQLEKKALVVRETLNTDRRVKPVRLTRKGRNRVERAMAAVQRETHEGFYSGISAKQLKLLRDQLYSLLAHSE